MMRRFVNLVVDTAGGGGDATAYKLYRVAASALFSCPARRQAAKVLDPDDVEDAAGGLPPPAITFHPSSLSGPGNVDFLYLYGSGGGSDGDDSLLALDVDGRGLLYSAASAAVRYMPDPCKPKIEPISFTADDGRLYVIERVPLSGNPGCFEALTYGLLPDDDDSLSSRMGWYWRSLPPPPFAKAGYDITASAVVQLNESKELWVTAAHGAGTFSFDTNSKVGEWRELGEKGMPFMGRGEYVEEHGQWFGLSSTPRLGLYLCSCDLSYLCCSYDAQVMVRCWLDGLDRLPAAAPPKRSLLMETYAVHLGSGRFCIARFMEEEEQHNISLHPFFRVAGEKSKNDRFLLLTGVDVVGSDDAVVVHKSIRYAFQNGDFVRGYSRVF
ncbi:uncharacterized protein [Oryza sativa Japonica Group]|jgi:hypothetical protein|uniref:Os02g0107600 protein n=3 Tax=Oryza sativa TaxID=4530 RepID=Q0E4N9_ORYSJ|nr:uncharacterized protein LOC4328027 [Oryza sativa Japonica Group]EAY84123.1 hypothetical protein OsI_05506 [Oryza sativa Indica Group]KAB8085492.1 hypothetical protein EE612_008340 [Oryza sativa]EAZ21436.1 hypothetical protein OsJ_05039 [Oryza sativa Japonica Group]KAF2942585.1 hypothetical protein DAI22_02g006700 [Oryza sativa Japonica Group]BAD27931.1 unknown protein [Oryza sativa Japonica Group]|eukprot:NP_001045635.1 Os02g0107600 [Oryza sativa Japonica Group]